MTKTSELLAAESPVDTDFRAGIAWSGKRNLRDWIACEGAFAALCQAPDDSGASARICNLPGVVLNKRPLFRLGCD